MDFERLFDLLPYRAKRFPNSIAAAGRQDGHWQTLSIEDAIQLCDRLSTGMLHQGWKKGDVIILSATTGSPAWQIIDFAAQQAGIIPVPVHPSSPDAERDYILRETQPKACFVANSLLLKSWKGHWPQQQYFTLQPGGEQPYWQDLLTEEIDITALEQARSQVRPEDLATIVYTSGTTGEPKGVMLSHRNIVSNIKSTLPLVPINYRSTTLSFLPLTHIFERMVTWSYWAAGATTYFAQNSDSVLTDMQEVRPHYFTAVPRLLERMYERIHERAGKSGWLVKNIIRWAIKLGEAYEPFKRPLPWYGLQLVLADILVYRRWRRLLGGRVKGVAVGAAALSANLSRLFSAAGVAIREGYGMTEVGPIIAFNRFEPGGYRFGTAGRNAYSRN